MVVNGSDSLSHNIPEGVHSNIRAVEWMSFYPTSSVVAVLLIDWRKRSSHSLTDLGGRVIWLSRTSDIDEDDEHGFWKSHDDDHINKEDFIECKSVDEHNSVTTASIIHLKDENNHNDNT
jgi:hypothetical protein